MGKWCRELLPQDQIAAALSTPDIRRNMAELAGETVARRVASFPVLRPFPRALRAAVAQQVAKAVNREVRSLLADEGPEMVNRVLSSVDIAQLVADELNAMDWDYLEAIVYSVAGKELKLIEVMVEYWGLDWAGPGRRRILCLTSFFNRV